MDNIIYLTDAESKARNIKTAVNSINKVFENFDDLTNLIEKTSKTAYFTEELTSYCDILIYHTARIKDDTRAILHDIETIQHNLLKGCTDARQSTGADAEPEQEKNTGADEEQPEK